MQLFAQQPTTFEWPTEALGKTDLRPLPILP